MKIKVDQNHLTDCLLKHSRGEYNSQVDFMDDLCPTFNKWLLGEYKKWQAKQTKA